MNLHTDRIQALYEEPRLPGVWENHEALAKNAAETEHSFVDFLEAARNAERYSRRARSERVKIRCRSFDSIYCNKGDEP